MPLKAISAALISLNTAHGDFVTRKALILLDVRAYALVTLNVRKTRIKAESGRMKAKLLKI
jgi:hypothetical protein